MPGVVNTTDTFATNQVITSTLMNNIIDQTFFTTDALANGTLALSSGKMKVATTGITANEMAVNSVTVNAIADNAVTTVKILDANVTTAKIADVAVTTAKITDANITTAKIADASVTGPKLNGEQTGTAPIYGIRAWGSFDSSKNDDLGGTYSRTGTTVTLTVTAHGLIANNLVFIDFTVGSGTAPFDGLYEVASVTDANTFTVISSASTSSTGTASLKRKEIKASGNISCISAAASNPTIPPTSNDSPNDGFYVANFSIALPNANFSMFGTSSGDKDFTTGSGNDMLSGSPYNSASARILCVDFGSTGRAADFNSFAIIG